jgi:glycosyltransferase involved in cell wall biosynthesis
MATFRRWGGQDLRIYESGCGLVKGEESHFVSVARKGVQFQGRVGLQQRVLPAYRSLFLDRLASACTGGLSVFAGMPRPEEAILPTDHLEVAHYISARNVHIMHGSFYFCWQLGIVEWLERWDPAALILEANPRYLTNWKAIDWMRRRGRPVLGWGLGAPPLYGPLGCARRWARHRYIRRFDALLAYSERGAEQYQAAGIPLERIFVAHNAVMPPPPPIPRRPVTSSLLPKVLFVGRLQARKRVDLLLRACAALDQPVELNVVGDGPARGDLECLAKEVYPRAHFVGAQQGADLDHIFSKADLFVLPGTGGLAVQQAMAHGLPVIVAEGDGTQNDLVAGGNGWLVPTGDLAALTAVLREALSDPKRLRDMGAESHRLAGERFNIDIMVGVFAKALNAASGER